MYKSLNYCSVRVIQYLSSSQLLSKEGNQQLILNRIVLFLQNQNEAYHSIPSLTVHQLTATLNNPLTLFYDLSNSSGILPQFVNPLAWPCDTHLVSLRAIARHTNPQASRKPHKLSEANIQTTRQEEGNQTGFQYSGAQSRKGTELMSCVGNCVLITLHRWAVSCLVVNHNKHVTTQSCYNDSNHVSSRY